MDRASEAALKSRSPQLQPTFLLEPPSRERVFGIAVVGVIIYALMLAQFHLPPIRRNRENSVLQDMLAGLKYVWDKRIFERK